MARISRSSYIAALLAVAASAQAGDKAQELLKKSMARAFNVNIVSILLQRDPSGDGTYQKLKVERSSDGKTHHMVLQPLRLYGVESVDNGDRNLIFLPDDKLVVDQPSSGSAMEGASERLKLVCKNYKLQIDGQSKIAGRSVTIVAADSRYGDLGTRRFYIDSVTGYPLRMEMVDGAGNVTVYYDTKDIQYPKSLAPGIFKIKPMGKVRQVRYDKPDTFYTAGDARTAIGFSPVLPKTLPYGFKVTEMQNTQDPNWRALVVRMTDGLVRATLYQWRSGGDTPDVKAYMDRTVREVNGVRLLLVSELNARQRDRLIDAFVNRLQTSPVVQNICIVRVQGNVGQR